jgi:uncharacterized membrane protein YbaN (DUF454 family)
MEYKLNQKQIGIKRRESYLAIVFITLIILIGAAGIIGPNHSRVRFIAVIAFIIFYSRSGTLNNPEGSIVIEKYNRIPYVFLPLIDEVIFMVLTRAFHKKSLEVTWKRAGVSTSPQFHVSSPRKLSLDFGLNLVSYKDWR